MPRTLISDNLVALRKRNRLSQPEVAAAIGVRTYVTVSNHERGVTAPDEDQLQKYAAVYGVTVSDIRYERLADGQAPAREEAPAAAAAALPESAREYLAEAQLELVRAGLTDEQIRLALACLQSEPWLALWASLRGESPVRDVLLDGMRAGTKLVRQAALAGALERQMYDGGDRQAAQDEVLRILAKNQDLIGPRVPTKAEAAASGEHAPATQPAKRKQA